MDEDDEFWTTYIAATPEEDTDFADRGRASGWVVLVILGGLALVWLLSR